MTAPSYSNPDYNPAVWSPGYQACQVGVAGPSVFEAMANPPAAMAAAVTHPEYPVGTTEVLPR